MKILIEIRHGLGDIVQMIPLFKKIREHYPSEEIIAIVASQEHENLLRRVDVVDKYYIFNMRSLSLWEQISCLRKLGRERIHLAILAPMTSTNKGKLMMKLIGCPRTIFLKKDAIGTEYTITEKIGLLLRDIGINEKIDNPQICVSDDLLQIGDNLLEEKGMYSHNLVGICMGTGVVVKKKFGIIKQTSNAKAINMATAIEVAELLAAKGYAVILFGGTQEKMLARDYTTNLKGKILDLMGETSIIESMALLAKCRLVIGGDTGLIHMADALGIRTLIYYGASGPSVGPFSDKCERLSAELDCQYCYGTERLFKCEDRKCLSYITPERLYEKAEELLNKRSKG